ncbi:hypothetical protein BaOVIS_015310 [Babesia ovis]|uniref:Non-structural maintenance of chromosome element 4 C-terminal domain-containing protein n=1 Tax=Babesia ovis TaxID=5869 RepID=A0A9W5TA02_BABOV|nr:hypothetical protein BaOVIS_015310 [Babesia ovis]
MAGEPEPEDPAQECVDQVQFHQIDESIDQLDFVNLSSFDANVDLQSAIDQDAYIINNVVSRIGVSKALTHGVKLSSIIKAKALRLNEVTAQELLGVVLTLYCNNFATDDVVPLQSKHRSRQENDGDGPKELDFTKLSKFFSSKALGYSPLSWGTLPRPANDEQQPLSQQTKRARAEGNRVTTTESKRKELGTMVDYKEALEIQKHTDVIRTKLLEASEGQPVSFWDFVIDDDPVNGYNRTCQNIYSLTFLIVKGFAGFTEREQEMLLQGIQEAKSGDKNSQGVVSALSYDKWQQLVAQRRATHKQK